jgi:molecular chaperone GrpE
MGKSNGQADIRIEDERHHADLEHELPAADPADGFQEKTPSREETPAAAPSAEALREADLKKLQEERDLLFDRLARLQAEFDNYRKRATKENADFRDYAVADAVRSLLPVIDNLSLAVKNASASPEDFRKGVELIHKQLQATLEKMNVQRVPAQGEPFDPRYHEAIEVVESDAVPDHHVLEELQPGYRIKDRLLRPAMVRVAKQAG